MPDNTRRRRSLPTILAQTGLPLSLNFSNFANGPMPGSLIGATWTISSGKAVNNPTLGAELITDGGLENWASSTDLTSWSESLAGTSTVNQSTDTHGGTYSARHDIDASVSQVQIYQTITLAIKKWLSLEYWLKGSSAAVAGGAQATGANVTDFAYFPGTNWIKHATTGFVTTANPQFFFKIAAAANTSIYFDDISVKEITPSTLYAYFKASTPLVRVSANWIIQSNALAGVIACLDNPANPQNYVVLAHSGLDNKLRLIKCVAGTFTLVLNQASVTYVSGAAVELRHTAANTWQCFYNNSQISTDQTISDAGIIDNLYHGVFSAHGGSQLNSFFLKWSARVIFSGP